MANSSESENITDSEELPIMSINKMNQRQIRRLNISPTFREQLDHICEQKAKDTESGIEKQKVIRGKDKMDNSNNIPTPPIMPRNREQLRKIEWYTGTKKKIVSDKMQEIQVQNTAPD